MDLQKLGVTASRLKLSVRQSTTVYGLLTTLLDHGYRELHHGCCEGGDELIAIKAKQLGYKIVGYPPRNTSYLMKDMSINDMLLRPQDYLARDRDIVNNVDSLIVCPNSMKPYPHSGTWYTYNYAKTRIPTILILPKS